MTDRRPYAPPEDPDDIPEDNTFDGLPADVELDFNDRSRTDEFAPSDDEDDDWYDEDDEFADDDVEFIEDEVF